MTAIFKKEFKSYFNDLTGYLFIAAFCLSFSVLFLQYCIFAGRNVLPDVFSAMSSMLILFTPLLTVQHFTMERRQNTWTLLAYSVVSAASVVIGKFLAAAAVLSACVLSTWLYAAVLSFYTTVYVGELICCQVGLLALGCVYLAAGELISSLCRRRLTAAAITLCALFLVSAAASSASLTDGGFLGKLLELLSPYTFFSRFTLGIFSFSSVLFLAVYAAVCLIITTRCVEYGRVRGI